MSDERNDWRLGKLNELIVELEAQTPRLREERGAAAKRWARARRRLAYLRLARAVRRPGASMELWPWGVLTVGPLAAGVVAILLASVFSSSLGVSLVAFLLGAALGAAALAWLLFRPSDAVLPAELAEAEIKAALAEALLKDLAQRSAGAADELRRAVEERRELVASGQVQRAALLQRPWKSMGPGEWEDFVVEVCRTLGYDAERTVGAAPLDVRLVVSAAGRRVAIVTQGEGQIINSDAVRHAIQGKQRHKTEQCAVVVNRRFTGAAQDFAQRQKCTLVGVEEFPDFVLGKLEL